MNRQRFRDHVTDMDNVIQVCFGQPRGEELPQVCTLEDVMVDLMQTSSGRPHHVVEAEFHHQIPSDDNYWTH